MIASNFSDPENSIETGDPEAKYANYFRVGHNVYEFVVDCGQAHGERVTIHSRIVMAPGYVRELLKVLHQAIGEYEDRFGSLGK